MSDPKGFYEILGIAPGSSIEECRKAYRRKQRIYHPDFGTKKRELDNIEDEEVRKEKLRELIEISAKLNEAKNTLDDEEKKKRYDMGMDENAHGFDGSSIFDFFTGFGRRRDNGMRKVEDTVFKVNISLKESFLGKTSKFKVRRKTICKGCNGKGGENATTCTTCHGLGKIQRQHRRGMFISVEESVCGNCNGEKTVVTGAKCKDCNGNKYKQEELLLEVKISPGVNTGERITYTGKGDEKVGHVPGDLIFYIIVKEDKKYKRIKDDLISTIDVDLYTILAGGKVYFTHIDDRVLEINIPRITDLEKVLIVRREGMANRGDLYLKPKFIINEKIDLNKLKEVIPPLLKAEKSVNESVAATIGELPEEEVEEDEGGFSGFRFFA
ncbi:Mitochondrial protein import protein mas5 [Astathelohania contejeani]|uniref:Mitochondrial protein import protein mas5 n=1 Tax=Astathelohania contejeani TaxID=164912 RepID=A0ABQ7I1T0_9MICR|nr:Mitochondrial protein import protein mas5 [Thelohania contejeani]